MVLQAIANTDMNEVCERASASVHECTSGCRRAGVNEWARASECVRARMGAGERGACGHEWVQASMRTGAQEWVQV